MPDKEIKVENDDPKILAESLYKQNIQILGKNKTLSLLSKLYEISILTLSPKDIAARVTQSVLDDLSFELVGILHFSNTNAELTPLAFASSVRLQRIQSQFNTFFNNITLSVKDSSFLNQIIETKAVDNGVALDNIWRVEVSKEMITGITSQGHVKTTIVYPLIIQDKVIGLLVLSLNRLYVDLLEHEKESIESFVNVIAVALDKALLYEQLEQANEQLKILDQARSEFITIASHQLRTPPATIKWYLAAILDGDYGKFDEDVKQQLRKTMFTNNSMIALIDDMLNVSRIERGKMEFIFQPTDLVEITQVTVDQLLPQAEQKKLNLVWEKPKEPLPVISADKEKLRQVINNLIDNAIKYTQEGSVKVEVGQNKNDLFVKVTDSGRGVSKDQLNHIFEKFDRGKRPARNSTGLGLGLYVAKVIMEQHKGKIWVESKGEGKGSTFIFTIPANTKLENTTFDLTKTQKIK